MACGETHQQKSVVDLYGDYDSEAWVQNPRALDAAWHEFCEAHFAIYDDDIRAGQKAAAASGTLPPEDRGTYLLGGTCLKQLQRFQIARNFLIDAAYDTRCLLTDAVAKYNCADMSGLNATHIYTADVARAKSACAGSSCSARRRRRAPSGRAAAD